jgi:hypothetical protein
MNLVSPFEAFHISRPHELTALTPERAFNAIASLISVEQKGQFDDENEHDRELQHEPASLLELIDHD